MKLVSGVMLLVVFSFSVDAQRRQFAGVPVRTDVTDTLKKEDTVKVIKRIADSHITKDNRWRLYSRSLAEKSVSDSIMRADSIEAAQRRADSLRVEDSLVLARYNMADTALISERIRKEKELEAYKPVEIDSSERILRDSIDNISARTIVVNANSRYAREIDSLQNRMDSISNSIHDHDQWFQKMKTFPISEKKRYMVFLMQHNYKDSASILACCNKLYQMYSCRLDLLNAIRNSQNVNQRSFMTYHIEMLREQIGDLSNFIVAMSPKVPYHLQRRTRESPQ